MISQKLYGVDAASVAYRKVIVEIGLELKKRSPFANTVVVGIANGYNGYLPPPNQHELGGYEIWLGTSRVQEDASVLIIDQFLQMLAELNEETASKGIKASGRKDQT